jgi:outer membrane immunogenic protein
LFLRTEYRYSDYQSTTNPFVVTTTGVATPFGLRSNTYTQSIFTELVWRFNFGGMHW